MYASNEDDGYSVADYKGYAINSNVFAVAGGKFLPSFVVEGLNDDRRVSKAQFCKGSYFSEKDARLAAYADAERNIGSMPAR